MARGHGVASLLTLALSIASLACAAAAGKQCGAASDPAAEPEYNYSDVFSRERDQGIAFASEFLLFARASSCARESDDA